MVEFHPIVWMFDYFKEKPIIKYCFMQKEVIYEEYEGAYANLDSKIVSKDYELDTSTNMRKVHMMYFQI